MHYLNTRKASKYLSEILKTKGPVNNLIPFWLCMTWTQPRWLLVDSALAIVTNLHWNLIYYLGNNPDEIITCSFCLLQNEDSKHTEVIENETWIYNFLKKGWVLTWVKWYTSSLCSHIQQQLKSKSIICFLHFINSFSFVSFKLHQQLKAPILSTQNITPCLRNKSYKRHLTITKFSLITENNTQTKALTKLKIMRRVM